MENQQKAYDFVVFGASGFTGKYVCEELHDVIQSNNYNYKWAVAGRNSNKLENCLCGMVARKKLTEEQKLNVGIITADVDDYDSLLSMCKRTKVLLDCVGPYRLYGEQVVKACIEAQADFLDISGEPIYLENMRVKYNDVAMENGIYIIGACGFDSIPSDMAVIFARQKFKGTLNSLESYFEWIIGRNGLSLNYGTYASMVHAIADANTKEDYKKLTNYKGATVGPKQKIKSAHWVSSRNAYAIPFPGPDMQIVRKSQEYIHEEFNLPPIQYSMYLTFKHMWQLLGLIFFFISVKTFSISRWGKNLLLKHPKFFSYNIYSHEGPTEVQIKETSFCLHIKGKGYSDCKSVCNRTDLPDRTISIKVKGPELAYVTTPITIVQAAVTLLLERSKIPSTGGALTTASAFFNTSIIERMHNRGLTFEVVGSNEFD